jgi:hypothetical protein
MPTHPAVPLLMILFVAGCDAIPHAAKEAPPLQGSATCQAGGENAWGRPDRNPIATIVMNNDGFWCWMMSTESQGGRSYGPWLRMTKPPLYGTVQIDILETHTRVAYRPNPGFVGTDAFQTISRELAYEVDYRVTVTK